MLGLLLSPTLSQAKKRYQLDRYQTELHLRPDGTLRVIETIGFQFEGGEFTYAFREVGRADADSISAVAVRSDEVEIEQVKAKQKGRDWEIRWEFPPRAEAATFTLEYIAHGSLRSDDDQNELSWWVVDKGWKVPVSGIEAKVFLPYAEMTADSLEVDPGSGQITTGADGPVISFTSEPLSAKQAFEVEVRFPERIEVIEDHSLRNAIFWGLGLSLLGILVAAVLTVKKPKLSGSEPTGHEPPGLSIAEAGYLAFDDDSSRQRLFQAMMFDLAQRGYLRLVREQKSRWGQEQVRAEVLPREEGLSDLEWKFLGELKRKPKLSEFGQSTNSFRIETLKALHQQLLREGYYRSIKEETQRYLLPGAIALPVGVVSLFVLPLSLAGIVGGALIGASLALLILSSQRYLHTEKGVRQQAEIKAYVKNKRRDIDGLRNQGQAAEAARRLMRDLSWLLLDPQVESMWLNRLRRSLQKSDAQLELPAWLVDPTGEMSTQDAMAVFVPLMVMVNSTGSAVGAAGGGGGGGGGGGAG